MRWKTSLEKERKPMTAVKENGGKDANHRIARQLRIHISRVAAETRDAFTAIEHTT